MRNWCTRLAGRMVPGATVPPPYSAVMGKDTEEEQFAVFRAGPVPSTSPQMMSTDPVHNLTFILMRHDAVKLSDARGEPERFTTASGRHLSLSRYTSGERGGPPVTRYTGDVDGVSIVVTGPEKTFDRPALDAFVHSIH